MSRIAWIVALVLAAGLGPAARAAGDGTAAGAAAPAAEGSAAKDPAADGAPANGDAAPGTDAKGDGDGAAKKDGGPKQISGMSVLGNQEAPKSLVIVPWKSSEIGDSLGIATMLDGSVTPVDREVFLRELRYYEIRSERTP